MTSKAKTGAAVVVLLALVSAPAVVASAVGAGAVAGSLVTACLAGLLAAVFAPARDAMITAGALAIAAAFAVPAASAPVAGALLMAACGAAMGGAAMRGVSSAVYMAPVFVGFLLSDPPDASPIETGVACGAAALFGVMLGVFVRRRMPRKDIEPVHVVRAAAYGAMLALLAGVAAWIVVSQGLGHVGGWVLMTIFIVVQPYLQDGWDKSVQRAAGTVLGFVVAIGVGIVLDVRWVVFALGIAAMVFGIWDRIRGCPYWRYVAAITVGVVFTQGASTSVVSTSEQRLVSTVAAVAASLLAMAVLQPLYKRGAQKAGVDHY